MSNPPDKVNSEEQIQLAINRFGNTKLKCATCGAPFSLTEEAIRFFLGKGLRLPKRCRQCRGKSHDGPSTPPAMQNKFFANPDPTRIPMVPWRHT